MTSPTLLRHDAGHLRQRLYPVVNPSGELVGVIGRRELDRHLDLDGDPQATVSDLIKPVTGCRGITG